MNAVDRLNGQSCHGRHESLAATFMQFLQDQWMTFGDQQAFVERLATLTDMHMVVLSLLAQGKLNKQIAFSCGISEATVKAHVSELLSRLDANSRTEAAVKFAVISERIRLNRTLTNCDIGPAQMVFIENGEIRPHI
ncbi:MAG: response regulator transcription factor [Beijerinckiaceae bacterium]|nr:response regulator transcription factor [Beijerinckiaceae bacterium]